MIPPRKDNDKTILHRHTNINGPRDEDPVPPFPQRKSALEQELLDAINHFNREQQWTTGAYSLAIGLLIGLILGWASA